MSGAFARLLAPGRIGSMELRNRILLAPMGDSLAHPDGSVSETQAAFYEARARGGVGMVLVGSVSVSYPFGAFDARQTAGSDDRFVPGLRLLADRVHAHGATIAAQLVHNGQMALYDVAQGHPMLVPAIPKRPRPDRLSMMMTEPELAAVMSPYAVPGADVRYQEATDADLEGVIEQFVAAVERCRAAGFDGVELHAGHGYLIDEFLTPALNTRTDRWGGSVEGRARLLVEVLRAIRARTGPDFPLWIRINALEHHKPNGERFEEQLAVIDLAAAAGIDAVHVTQYASTDVATGPTDSYAPHRVGDLAEQAAVVRERTGLPVITFGRFEPDEAEAVLAAGQADFVAMARKLLADPDLPAKLAAGRVDKVRPCIYQYRCIGNIFVKDVVHCVANAATGREDTLGPHAIDAHGNASLSTAAPRRILVIGGGPGGLETARLAAAAGHEVTVWEAGERLGGALALAARADPLLDRYLGWLLREVAATPTTIELGHPATVEGIRAAAFDEVVLALGARWARPSVPGSELGHVLTVPELRPWLDGDDRSSADLGTRVVVLGGGKPGLTLAAEARRRGHAVTVLEPTAVFAPELGLPGRWRLVADAEADGITLVGGAAVAAITADAVVTTVDGSEQTFATDSVVIASGRIPDVALATDLRAAGLAPHLVGDCRTTAGLEGVNLDAAQLVGRIAAHP